MRKKQNRKPLCPTVYLVARIETIADGNRVSLLPTALLEDLRWEMDDTLSWQLSNAPDSWVIQNLSVRVLYASRARRNYRSLANALNAAAKPLRRAFVESTSAAVDAFVLIPASTYQRVVDSQLDSKKES